MAFNHGHALIIGVGTYEHTPQMNVPITAADAEALATVLRNPTYCGYPENQVTLLHDSTATRAGILAALDALAARAGKNDTILLFYSGHGHTGSDGTYYLTTHDTQLTAGQVTPLTGVSETELIAKLQALTARRILILINACHAGELSPVLEPGEPPFTGTPLAEKTAATLLATGEGRVIITACREDQYAYIGSGPLTLFTQALVNGLQGKGDYVSNRQGFISIFDLYSHLYATLQEQVARHIPEAVRQRYSPVQEPELTVLKGVGPFAVALYHGATALGEFQAPGYVTEGVAVNEVDAARRERLASRLHQQTIGDHAQVGAAVAGNVQGNISVDQHTEHIDAREAQGFINRPAGPVSQHFGDQRNIHTGGGTYVEGDIDQRSGSFVAGDTISVGDITGTSGIAVGRQAHAEVHREDQLQTRRFEAAMPETAIVGRPTEVRVMIALEGSAGLRAKLPDFTESGELIKREDVEDSMVRLEFPPGTQFIEVRLRIDAPDFTVTEPEQPLRVPVDGDSGVATFALTPCQENENGRVIVRLYHNKVLIDSLTLLVAVKPEHVTIRKIVWRMLSSNLSLSRVQPSLAAAGPQHVTNVTIERTVYELHHEDQRQGNFVDGDQVNMPGNFSGAMLTIKSTLEHVSQSIANAPHDDCATKAQLQQLIAALNAELQQAPPDRVAEGEQVARRAEAAVAAATAPTPDREDVQYQLSRLTQAAAKLGAALPTVPSIVEQIAAAVNKMFR